MNIVTQVNVCAPVSESVTLLVMSKRQRVEYLIAQFAYDHGGQGSDERRWVILLPTNTAAPTLPYPVAVKLGRSADGRLECVAMRLGADAIPGYDATLSGAPVTSRTLRDIPVAQIVGDLARMQPLPVSEAHAAGERLKATTIEHATPRPHPGRRGYALAFYEGIRDLYREALEASPGRVYRYIVEHARDADGRLIYGVTARDDAQHSREAVARRWVMQTRQKGLLGPARHGKAGEYDATGPSRESGLDTSTQQKEE